MSPPCLRPATAADHALYSHFFAQLGLEDAPLVRGRWETENAATTAFFVEDGKEVGYAFWELAGENAYVKHVVIDAGARGRGLGRDLMLRLAAKLRGEGASAWRLNVMASNHVAAGLYGTLGMSTIFSTVVLRLSFENLGRLPQVPARGVDAEARFDAANELDFGLLDGQLTRARQKLGARIVAALSVNGKCMGVAVFDPQYPGAFPFRCKSVEYARTLIEALRERYEGPSSFVQLVIEDAAVVVHALESAGATRVHDILHMRGPIPRESPPIGAS